MATNKIWFRKNGGNWNDDPSADPATLAGGYDIGPTTGRLMAPMVAVGDGTVTCNFGASPFTYTVPSGYYAGWPNTSLSGFTTLDPASQYNVGAPGSLSGGNLVASSGLTQTAWFASDFFVDGKYYFEITMTSLGPFSFDTATGVGAFGAQLLQAVLGNGDFDGNSLHNWGGGNLLNSFPNLDSATVNTCGTSVAVNALSFDTGDVISVAAAIYPLAPGVEGDTGIGTLTFISQPDVVMVLQSIGATGLAGVAGPPHLNANVTLHSVSGVGHVGVDTPLVIEPMLAMQSFAVIENTTQMTPRLCETRHDEWLLMRPGDETSLPPLLLWKQLRDSLSGFDDYQRVLPDNHLSKWRNTGTYPGQNMFVIPDLDDQRGGLMAARASFIGIVNNILARNPVAIERSSFISTIYRSAPIDDNLIWSQTDHYTFEPPPMSEWDRQVYTLTERNRLVMRPDFQDALASGSTIRVLMNGIGEPTQRWSIWNFAAPGLGWDDNAWDILTLGWDSLPADLGQYVDQIFTLRPSYEVAVDTTAERDALVTPIATINVGDRVLVRHDAMDFWAVWRWDGTPSTGNPVDGFVLTRIQYYRTDDFIDYVDWYDTGFSASSPPIVSYPTQQARNLTEGPNPTNLFVRVDNDGSGAWIWTEWDSIAHQWTTVAIQNGTIALSSKLCDATRPQTFTANTELYGWDETTWDGVGLTAPWDAPEAIATQTLIDAIFKRDGSWEMRVLADALRYGGLLLDSEINEVFFSMLNFVHAQQDQVTWAFKTSFMALLGYNVPLQQTPFIVQDTTPSLISYIDEVKPYRVKLREFSTQYNPDIDVANVHATDYDKPLYFDPVLNAYRVLDPNDSGDLAIITSTQPWSDWYEARADARVRSFDMTILFDRITNESSLGWGDGAWDNDDWDGRDTAANYIWLHTTIVTTLSHNGPTIQVDDVRWLRYLWQEDELTAVSDTNSLRLLINGNPYLVQSVAVDDTNVSTTRGGMSGTLTTSIGHFTTSDGAAGTLVEAIIPQPSASKRITDYYVATDGMPPKDLTLLLDLDYRGTQFSLVTSQTVSSGNVLPFADTTNVLLGLPVFGPRIVKGAIVTDFASTTVTLSVPVVGPIPAGATVSFGLPTVIDGYILPIFTSSDAFDVPPFDETEFDVDSGLFDVTYDGSTPLDNPNGGIIDDNINPPLPNRPYGLSLRDPYFAANHPQERAPFTSDDALQMVVTAQPLVGGPSQLIRVFNVSGMSSPATFFFDLVAHSSAAVLVYRDGIRATLGVDYTVNYFDRTVENLDIVGVSFVQIHTFGFGGTSLINADESTQMDNRYFYAFDSNPLRLQQTSDTAHARVVVDGVALGGGEYSVSGTLVTLTTPPSVGADVAIVLYDGGITTASEIQFQTWTYTSGPQTFQLSPFDSITAPPHGGTIVEVDGVRLRPPTTFYGAFTTDDPWMFLPDYPDNTDTISVYVDGSLYTTPIPFCTDTDPGSPYPFKLVVPIGQTPPTNIAGQFVFFDGLMVALDPAFVSDNVSVVIIPPSPLPDYQIDSSGLITINAPLSSPSDVSAFFFTNADSMGWQTVTYDIGDPAYIMPIPFSKNYALVAMDGDAIAPVEDYTFDTFDIGWDTLPLDSVPYDLTFEAAELVIDHPGGHSWVVASVCTAPAARELMRWMHYTNTPSFNRMPPALDNDGEQTRAFPTHGSVVNPLPQYESRFANLRLSPYLAGTLANDLLPADTQIVVDLLLRPLSSKLEPDLPLPTVFGDNPGVVWINGERIEYFNYSQVDNQALLSGLRRGTHGTSIQEQRNVTAATGTGTSTTYSVNGVGPVDVIINGMPVDADSFVVTVVSDVSHVTLTADLGAAIVLGITVGYTYSAGTVVYNGQEDFTLPVPLGLACGNRDLLPMQRIISG